MSLRGFLRGFLRGLRGREGERYELTPRGWERLVGRRRWGQ